jgi:glycosyltransferase involved in cell wall biosynthesis
MAKISVVINTLNEERNLPRALESVKDFADEIVVVDMRSEDRTVEIATRYGAKVHGHERTGYVEPARNFAIQKAEGDWILILDADEKLPATLAKWLKREIKAPRSDYYRLARRNIIFGKWIKHSRWWPDYNIRFFKKGYVSWSEVIHSVPTTTGSGFDVSPEPELAVTHFHYETIEQYIGRLNRYTTEHAKLIQKTGYKFSWRDLIKKPANEFLSRYFFGQGYKDGIHGLALSGLQSFSELVVLLKIWQNEGFEAKPIGLKSFGNELKMTERDMGFWLNDSLYKKYGGIIYKIKRKLKLL